MKPGFSLSPSLLLWAVSAFLLATANGQYFQQTIAVYDIGQYLPFLISQAIVLLAAIMLFATLFSLFLPVRLVAILFLITGAISGYFSDTLGIAIDKEMIRNVISTNVSEAWDLINWGFALRVGLFGLLPSLLLLIIPISKRPLFTRERRLVTAALAAILLAIVSMAPFTESYASLFREHKPLRYFTNPTHPIYSAIKLAVESGASATDTTFRHRVATSTIPASDAEQELVIVVIGETARADHFGINGYARQTTPLLAKRERVITFRNMQSCGTSTAVSLPCMFSLDRRGDFDIDTARYTENVLDVLAKAGVSVLWRDNNTGDQGVATRVTYQRFNGPDLNPVCDEEECRDIGMLTGLEDYIAQQDGDILIVLHQIGSHGPAYFKRYPDAFATFQPDCRTKELGACSGSEIINAYDNSILYTDAFLDAAIGFLEGQQDRYETSLIYLSDHGESLGEMGVYLHGMPYVVAPDSQTHVPFVIWAGESSDIDGEQLRARADDPMSHDDFSKLLLEAFEIIIDDKPVAHNKPILPVHHEEYTH